MKKLLLIISLIPFVSFGQNLNINKKVEIREEKKYLDAIESEYIKYQGSGYFLGQIFASGKFMKTLGINAGLPKKGKIGKYSVIIEQELLEIIKKFCGGHNLFYEIVSKETATINYTPSVSIRFQATKKDGSLYITKNEARDELLMLKEYLDLGLITQKEFDDKAVQFKKVLLGN